MGESRLQLVQNCSNCVSYFECQNGIGEQCKHVELQTLHSPLMSCQGLLHEMMEILHDWQRSRKSAMHSFRAVYCGYACTAHAISVCYDFHHIKQPQDHVLALLDISSCCLLSGSNLQMGNCLVICCWPSDCRHTNAQICSCLEACYWMLIHTVSQIVSQTMSQMVSQMVKDSASCKILRVQARTAVAWVWKG